MNKKMHFKDLTGEKFGKLTVLWIAGYDGTPNKQKVYWLCICDCGNFIPVLASSLKSNTHSCGCLHHERITKHGMKNSLEYSCYNGAKNRCTNFKNQAFLDYGGRGIKFKFRSFKEFYEHIEPKPSSEYSLERINNNGHYEKGNVKWATAKEQADNRRTKRLENFTNEEIKVEFIRRGLNASI